MSIQLSHAPDWYCCRETQFGSRAFCRKCRKPNPTRAAAHEQKAGDWICIGCNDVQFAKNTKCRRCNWDKPSVPVTSPVVPPPQLRAGDWACPQCKNFQFASRVLCRDCGASKPAPDDDTIGADDDTSCLICSVSVRNAAIVHGDSLHIVACIACAKDLLSNSQPCPMCRQPIERVLTAYK